MRHQPNRFPRRDIKQRTFDPFYDPSIVMWCSYTTSCGVQFCQPYLTVQAYEEGLCGLIWIIRPFPKRSPPFIVPSPTSAEVGDARSVKYLNDKATICDQKCFASGSLPLGPPTQVMKLSFFVRDCNFPFV